jgi:hypothetical protein
VSESPPHYMVHNERTGEVLGTNLTLSAALRLQRLNPWDIRITWQKHLGGRTDGSIQS